MKLVIRYNFDNEIRMTSNWEDVFDFQEAVVKATVRKNKRQIAEEMDFFEEEQPKPSFKLPLIAAQPSRNLIKSKNQALDEQFPQIHEDGAEAKIRPPSITTLPPKNIPKSGKVKQQSEDEEFYESLEDPTQAPKKPKEAYESKLMNEANDNVKQHSAHQKGTEIQEDNYEEQAYQEYGEDFDLVAANEPQKAESKQTIKSQQQTYNKTKPEIKSKAEVRTQGKDNSKAILPPKPQFTDKPQSKGRANASKEGKRPNSRTAKAKQQSKGSVLRVEIERPSSKKSVGSKGSEKKLRSESGWKQRVSSVKRQEGQDEVRDKHKLLVDRLLKDEKLEEMNADKLMRLNEKVRTMIKRFNDELNVQLQRSLTHVKDTVEWEPTAQERIRVLQEQVRSGSVNIQTMENELERLQGREGEVKEEEFELIVQRRIEECREKIKELARDIQKAKHEVAAGGNRLSRQETEKKQAQELHQLKTLLIQTKKDQEKNDLRLAKLEAALLDLSSKNTDKDYAIETHIDQAKEKGIALQRVDNAKHTELKNKLAALTAHIAKIQALTKAKCEHIGHDNIQLQTTIRMIQQETSSLCDSLEVAHSESVALLTKAKENPQLSASAAQSIAKMLRTLQENQPQHDEVRSEGEKSRVSTRPLKNSLQSNVKNSLSSNKNTLPGNGKSSLPNNLQSNSKAPVIGSSPILDSIPLSKPNFLKKKEYKDKEEVVKEASQFKVNDSQHERIWRGDERPKDPINSQTEQKKVQEVKIEAEEDKKKPFTLKKNRMNEAKIDIQHKEEPKLLVQEPKQKSKEEVPVAPKLIKLNRRKEANVDDTLLTQPKIQLKPQPKIQIPKEEEDQETPVFAPRRLLQRKQMQKKEQLYTPTMDQPKPTMEEEYKPKMNFLEQNKAKQNIIDGNQEIPVEITEEKPKITLRLRDRKKPVEEQNVYAPSQASFKQPVKEEYDPLAFLKGKTSLPEQQTSIKQFNLSKKEQSPLIIKKENPVIKNQHVSIDPKKEQKAYVEVKKEENTNLYGRKEDTNVNPYARKEEAAPKREREGPIKKLKIQKQIVKGNIFEEAEDLTEAVAPHISQEPRIQPAKEEALDLNSMLGIKQKAKPTELDDLLGEVSVPKKKQKKRTDDFFNDLQI